MELVCCCKDNDSDDDSDYDTDYFAGQLDEVVYSTKLIATDEC